MSAKLPKFLAEMNRILEFGERQLDLAQKQNGKIGLTTRGYEDLLELFGSVIERSPPMREILQPIINRTEKLLSAIETLNKIPLETLSLEIDITTLDGKGQHKGSMLEGLLDTLVKDKQIRLRLKQKIQAQEALEAVGFIKGLEDVGK
jgi:hypothetical protein